MTKVVELNTFINNVLDATKATEVSFDIGVCVYPEHDITLVDEDSKNRVKFTVTNPRKENHETA